MLGKAVQRLKQESGKGLFVGGVTLLAGHGPTVFCGIPSRG
jgi:hypothetical protein